MLRVMACNDNNPFADYLWMGEMEKFDEQLQEELLEEEFLKSCIEQLLEEEEERETVYFQPKNGQNGYHHLYQNSGSQQVPYEYTNGVESITQEMGSLYVNNKNNKPNHSNNPSRHLNQSMKNSQSTAPVKSTLNPNAAPFSFNPNAKTFVPRFSAPSQVIFSSQNGYVNNHAIPSRTLNGK